MPDKQYELQEILLELSRAQLEDEAAVNSCIQRLDAIYIDDFRHLYSGIFAIITRIDGNDGLKLDVLQQNISSLHEKSLEDKDYSELKPKLDKLYDHINLDIARIKYTKEIAIRMEEAYKATNKDLREISDRAENMQKEYITILGIFSSIVITFVAGMVFSSSVLNNVDKASVYRLTFVMLMIALFVFNLVYLLLDYISRINKGVTEARTAHYNQGNSVVAIINTVIFLMLIIDFVMWMCYWHRFS